MSESIFKKEIKLDFLKRGKVKAKDLILFYKQLSIMLTAGIGITDCFYILIDENKDNPSFRDVLKKIVEDLENGSKLSMAMSNHPKIFKSYEINVTKSGEATGKLDEVLNYVGEEMESNDDILHKVKSAMTYPIFVVGVMFCVFIIMIVYIFPKIMEMVTELDGNLPVTTKILMWVSSFLQKNMIFILIFLVLFIAWLLKFKKTEKGKMFFDKIKLKLPIVKNIFKKIYIVRFSRSFFTLLKSGIPINDALNICAEIIGNKVYEKAVFEVSDDIENGESIAGSFGKHEDIFPTIFIKMLSIGEKTGELDDLISKANIYFTKELQNIMGSLVTLIEPIIIVILGIGVAIIVSAVLLPMYSLSSQF